MDEADAKLLQTLQEFSKRQNATDSAIAIVCKAHGDLLAVHTRLIHILLELCIELAPEPNVAIRAFKGKVANLELTESQNHIIEPLLAGLPSVG